VLQLARLLRRALVRVHGARPGGVRVVGPGRRGAAHDHRTDQLRRRAGPHRERRAHRREVAHRPVAGAGRARFLSRRQASGVPLSRADLPAPIEEFLSWLAVERGRSTNTLVAYRRDLAAYVEFLNGRAVPIERVSEREVEEYV